MNNLTYYATFVNVPVKLQSASVLVNLVLSTYIVQVDGILVNASSHLVKLAEEKFLISNNVKLAQQLNIFDILVTCEVSKLDKYNEVKDLQT